MLTAREFLNVGEWDADNMIRPAYMALVRMYHPDKNGGGRPATIKFQILQAAYEAALAGNTDRLFPVWDHVEFADVASCAVCTWPQENRYVCTSCGNITTTSTETSFEFRKVFWYHVRHFVVGHRLPMARAHQMYRAQFGRDPVTNGTRFLTE